MHVDLTFYLALGAVLDAGAIEHGHLRVTVLSKVPKLATFDEVVTIRRVASLHSLSTIPLNKGVFHRSHMNVPHTIAIIARASNPLSIILLTSYSFVDPKTIYVESTCSFDLRDLFLRYFAIDEYAGAVRFNVSVGACCFALFVNLCVSFLFITQAPDLNLTEQFLALPIVINHAAPVHLANNPI
jgi:hypothetical protein